MWKKQTKPPTVKELQILKYTRRQLEIVNSARKRCSEIVSAHKVVKSPRLDGMPRGNNLPHGFDGSASECEVLLDMLKREEKKLRQYRNAAQKIIDRFPPSIYGFCLYYYLEGMSVEKTARMIDRSERAAWEYKVFVEQAANRAGKSSAGGCMIKKS